MVKSFMRTWVLESQPASDEMLLCVYSHQQETIDTSNMQASLVVVHLWTVPQLTDLWSLDHTVWFTGKKRGPPFSFTLLVKHKVPLNENLQKKQIPNFPERQKVQKKHPKHPGICEETYLQKLHQSWVGLSVTHALPTKWGKLEPCVNILSRGKHQHAHCQYWLPNLHLPLCAVHSVTPHFFYQLSTWFLARKHQR